MFKLYLCITIHLNDYKKNKKKGVFINNPTKENKKKHQV